MFKDVQLFKRKEFGSIRVIIINDSLWFIGQEIATRLEYSDRFVALNQFVSRKYKWIVSRDEFSQMPSKQVNDKLARTIFDTGTNRIQFLTFINEAGVYQLIFNSDSECVESFRKWIFEVIIPCIYAQRYEQQTQPITAVGKAMHDLPNVVNNIQSMFKVHDGIAMAQAIDIVGKSNNVDLSSLKQLIPSAKHKTGFMNATQVAEQVDCNLKAHDVNSSLARLGYIEKVGKDWRLTEKGFKYGEEFPYTIRNGHSGYQIRWNEDIVDIIRGNL